MLKAERYVELERLSEARCSSLSSRSLAFGVEVSNEGDDFRGETKAQLRDASDQRLDCFASKGCMVPRNTVIDVVKLQSFWCGRYGEVSRKRRLQEMVRSSFLAELKQCYHMLRIRIEESLYTPPSTEYTS